MPRTLKITAHRGSSAAAPENTLAAFELAIQQGADFAEIDVQLTADGEVVVVHDTDLSRVARLKRTVADLTLAQLKQLDVGSWFAPEFAAERIPTLAEVIAAVRGRLQLNIELKLGKNTEGLAERVVAVIERETFEEQCVLSSSDRAVLEYVRRCRPRLRIGRVVKTRLREPKRLAVEFLSVKDRYVDAALIAKAHAHGKQVHVWTVNDPARMQELIGWGVDNLITDVPAVLRMVLEQHAEAADESVVLPASP